MAEGTKSLDTRLAHISHSNWTFLLSHIQFFSCLLFSHTGMVRVRPDSHLSGHVWLCRFQPPQMVQRDRSAILQKLTTHRLWGRFHTLIECWSTWSRLIQVDIFVSARAVGINTHNVHLFIPHVSMCRGCTVVSTIASQEEGSMFDPHLGPFCVEFACSPRVCVGSLQVLRLPPTVQKHAC